MRCPMLKSSIMKTTYHLFYAFLFFFSTHSVAQSSLSMSYDTTVSGTGNGFYTFSFPKFNAQLGTLTEVEINTTVSLDYSYSLENKEATTISNYRVRVVREDEISGTALRVPLTSSFQKNYGPFSLAAWDNVAGSGTDYMAAGPLAVMNQYANTYTVYNTADFMGLGAIDITYMPMTYTIIFGGATYNFGGNSSDLLHFSITYHYLPNSSLASDITLFSAQKKDDKTIVINWITQTDTTDRIYELQKSTDGQHFSGVARIPAKADARETGSYSYQYAKQTAEASRLIFRIKQVEKNGSINYSPLRIVEFSKSPDEQPNIYPNPAKGAAHFLFSNKNRGNWEVYVYSTGGQLIHTYSFTNVLMAKLNTNNELRKGLYMVKAINKNTLETVVQQLLIQ